MSVTGSRYDKYADWYVDYTRDWEPAVAKLLPEELSGQRVADLGCGWGTLCRLLASRGAAVTGVDLSARLIEHARRREAVRPVGIDYRVADVTGTGWWDGMPFDGVVCAMALMDIDDTAGALSTVATVLRPGGWFTFSLFHPCYPGGAGDPKTLPSWPPDGGYSAEGWWTTGSAGVRGHVGANHRMMSTYLNAILHAGLEFVEFAETGNGLPEVFMARCRRKGVGVVKDRAMQGDAT